MINLIEHRLPLYETVYRQIREEIRTGQRIAGEKLPSKRNLAQQLGISINTIEAAYQQLESEGYIEARPRSGFYVLPLSVLEPAITTYEKQIETIDSNIPEVDFAVGAVDEKLFPMNVWQRLTRNCLNNPKVLKRSDAQGDFELRKEIARYLAQARGVHCSPGQILLGPGTDYLMQVLSGLLPSDCTLAVENPAYHNAYLHFSRLGHRVISVQMDGKGILVGPLEELDNAVVYTAPSHQYPLGFAMPMGRRTELLSWCARGKFRFVIEDDYDSEFRYDARPLPSLQSIDTLGRVIYLGTMSGVIAPSLRISYMILPQILLDVLNNQHEQYMCNISTLSQFVLREFMKQGYFVKHLNRMRVCYRNRRRELIQLLSNYASDLRVIGAPAGSYLLVQVEHAQGEIELCQAALDFGVRVYPISPYFIGDVPAEYNNTVLLGFGNLSSEQLEQGVSLLVQAWIGV